MTSSGQPAIQVSALTKVFGEGEATIEVLRSVNLSVARGEFLAVTGPSGSGKSTLLHLIAGLDVPTSGTIRVGAVDLRALDENQRTLMRRHNLGLIFQSFNLIDVLTAKENVALPLLISGEMERRANERSKAALFRVGLADRGDHLPTQLSGGEQQRVALARALVTNPLVLLADEPTGNLDSANGNIVISLLRSLVDTHGQTVIMVSHNPLHVAMADRIVWLRDGHVVGQEFGTECRTKSTRSAAGIRQ